MTLPLRVQNENIPCCTNKQAINDINILLCDNTVVTYYIQLDAKNKGKISNLGIDLMGFNARVRAPTRGSDVTD
jgi:hypothetical protein